MPQVITDKSKHPHESSYIEALKSGIECAHSIVKGDLSQLKRFSQAVETLFDSVEKNSGGGGLTNEGLILKTMALYLPVANLDDGIDLKKVTLITHLAKIFLRDLAKDDGQVLAKVA